MHVHTETALSPDQVNARLAAAGNAGSANITASRKLSYAMDRQPPKFFLSGAPVTLPAAAEVAIKARLGGADVVLRLMWGPLPAPFPRALAGAGLLCGLLMAIFSEGSLAGGLLALLVAALPALALVYQRSGERKIQAHLSGVLDGAQFTPSPH
jgi:hypothetical protein